MKNTVLLRSVARCSPPRVRIGAPDRSLTGLAGLAVVDECVRRLGMVTELDRGIGPIKVRSRGLTGGQLLLGMATGQLVGQDCLAGLDRVRADAGAGLLTAAPLAPSTTAGKLAGRFGPARPQRDRDRPGGDLPALVEQRARRGARPAGAG